MTHIKSRSYRIASDNVRGAEKLVDKKGKTLGVYDSIGKSNKAAKLISSTSEVKPKKKPMRAVSRRYPNG